MTKALKPYRDDDTRVSFDSRAFMKASTKAIANILSERMTPAEAGAFNAEQRDVLKRVEAILKFGQIAKRASKLDWK